MSADTTIDPNIANAELILTGDGISKPFKVSLFLNQEDDDDDVAVSRDLEDLLMDVLHAGLIPQYAALLRRVADALEVINKSA